MSGPQRIQRKRTKGFRLPPNTVCVDRTSRYGNPFTIERDGNGWRVFDSRNPDHLGWHRWTLARARALAVDEYAAISPAPVTFADLARIAAADFVACYCDPDDGMACHGDVLIEAALNLPSVSPYGRVTPVGDSRRCGSGDGLESTAGPSPKNERTQR